MAKYTLDETRSLKILMNQLRAFKETARSILNNKDAAEHARYASFKDMACMYNDFEKQATAIMKISSVTYTFNTEKMPGFMNVLWPDAKRILEQVLIATEMLYANIEGNMDFVNDEFDNLENFVKSRLRTVIFSKPEKEIEIQNAIESLFLGRGMSKGTDYDRETGKVEFSGKEFIPDFIIPKLKLCIEVKLLREGKKSKVIEEISADITAYGKQYERQLFVVYDLGVIQNEIEFRRDIENISDVKVIIVKH